MTFQVLPFLSFFPSFHFFFFITLSYLWFVSNFQLFIFLIFHSLSIIYHYFLFLTYCFLFFTSCFFSFIPCPQRLRHGVHPRPDQALPAPRRVLPRRVRGLPDDAHGRRDHLPRRHVPGRGVRHRRLRQRVLQGRKDRAGMHGNSLPLSLFLSFSHRPFCCLLTFVNCFNSLRPCSYRFWWFLLILILFSFFLFTIDCSLAERNSLH